MRGATQATAAGLRRPSPRADCRIADFSAFIGFAGIFPALPPRSGAAAVQDTDAQSIRRYCISQIVSAIINPSRRWMTVRRPHRLQAQKKYRSQAQAGEKGIGSRKGESMAYSLFLLVSTGFSYRAGSSPGGCRAARCSLTCHRYASQAKRNQQFQLSPSSHRARMCVRSSVFSPNFLIVRGMS